MHQIYRYKGRLCTFHDRKEETGYGANRTGRKPSRHRYQVRFKDVHTPLGVFVSKDEFLRAAKPVDMEQHVPHGIPCLECDGGVEESPLILPDHVSTATTLIRFQADYMGQIENEKTGERRFVYTCSNCRADSLKRVEELPDCFGK